MADTKSKQDRRSLQRGLPSDPRAGRTFGSLFSGIGGLDLGLERAGWECRWQVELDEWCRTILARHWPDVPRWNDAATFPPDAERGRRLETDGDARALGGTQPQDEGPQPEAGRGSAQSWNGGLGVDLIAGGFPCQPVSLAGKRRGQDDERWLWPEFARIVRVLRPRYVLVENVPGLLARGMGDVLGDLAASGYDTEWDCIPAAAVGAPHLRYRVFIVAYAQGERLEGWHNGSGRKHAESERLLPTGSGQSAFGGWWATEPDVGRVAHGVPSRVDRLRGLGNAVVPQVAEWIGRRLMES